jgi:hypothetical protein
VGLRTNSTEIVAYQVYGLYEIGRKEDTSDGYDNTDSNHRRCFGSRRSGVLGIPQKKREGSLAVGALNAQMGRRQ